MCTGEGPAGTGSVGLDRNRGLATRRTPDARQLGVERGALGRDLAEHLLLFHLLRLEAAAFGVEIVDHGGQLLDCGVAAGVRVVDEVGPAGGVERVVTEDRAETDIGVLVHDDGARGGDPARVFHARLRARDLALDVGDARVDASRVGLRREPTLRGDVDRTRGGRESFVRGHRVGGGCRNQARARQCTRPRRGESR